MGIVARMASTISRVSLILFSKLPVRKGQHEPTYRGERKHTSILVRAFVADRAQELVEQISMSVVYLDNVYKSKDMV